MWQETKHGLYKQFNFNDFNEAFGFMTSVARLAEQQNHHPRWENEWSVVQIWLITHEADSRITEKDYQLAEAIDALVRAQTPPESSAGLPRQEHVKIFADGGSRGNPGPSASGYVLIDPASNKVLVDKGIYLGITTNNQAEYLALKFALEEAQKLGARQVDVHMDSLLVVNQMKGIFKVKNRDLWPIHDAIQLLLKNFRQVTFAHVPREYNKLADAAVNRALDEELGLSKGNSAAGTT